MCVSQIVKDDISGCKVQYWVCDPHYPQSGLGSLLILGLHGQKPPSQIPQRSLPSYDERFYSLGVLRCRSFCNFGTSVDFFISREGYPMASLVGIGVRDENFQSAVFSPGR